MASLHPDELMLLQADTVEETVQWLRGYLQALADRTADEAEQAVSRPAGAAAEAAKTPAAETISRPEIVTPVLAESHAAGKV